MTNRSRFLTYAISFVAMIVHIQSHSVEQFHSTSYGYRINLPHGWVEIPYDILQERLAAIQKHKTGTTIIYDAGFQLDSTDQWLEFPYVLVQPIPYTKFGLHRQINEDEFPEFVRILTGSDVNKLVDKNITSDARQLFGEITTEHSILDSTNRRFFRTLNTDVQGIGPVRGLIVGYFGRDSIVQIAFYSRSAEWEHYVGAGQTIADSFRFDPNKAYSVELAVAKDSGLPSAQAVDSAREFLDGKRTTFSTEGHAKAKGVNFTIAFPNSWTAAEGERPNIVQKFVSENGRGLEMAMIITKELPPSRGATRTNEVLKELFAPSELRRMLPPRATFIDARSTEIEAEPAGILEYTMRTDSAGMTLMIHAWTLNFLSGNTLVQVQFAVAGKAESEGDVARRMTKFRPLFALMANSIVLSDKWADGPKAAVGSHTTPQSSSPLPYDDSSLLLLTLAVSFIVTWGIGLTPPLIIRYVFLRRPMSKKAASWVAAGFSAFFWMVFLAINNELGEKSGTGAVWIIMFFVARWIMSRGYVSEPSRPGQPSNQAETRRAARE